MAGDWLGEGTLCRWRADNTQGGLCPTWSSYPKRPLAGWVYTSGAWQTLRRWSWGRDSTRARTWSRVHRESLTPQARCGQRNGTLKVAKLEAWKSSRYMEGRTGRTEGQEGRSQETCSWLPGPCWWHRAEQGTHSPTSLGPLAQPALQATWSLGMQLPLLGGFLGVGPACLPQGWASASPRCRRKALRPTAGQVGCSRMVPPTQDGS